MFLDGTIVNVALPQLLLQFGGGLAFQQWVVDGYTLTVAAFILIAGALSDSLGRLTILRIGLIGFGVTSLLCAVSPTGELLIAFRAAQGLAGALLVPSSLALLASKYRGPVQTRAIGLWSAWTSAAFIAGPPLGGLLVDTVGWRWVFGINLPVVAVTLLAASRLHLPSTEARGRKIDVLGAFLAAAGLGGLVFALIEQGRLGWGDPFVLTFGAIGIAALTAYVLWERKATSPMMPLDLFRARNFSVGNATTFLVWGALWLGVFIVPVFLQQVAGFSGLVAGLATAPMTVISLLISSRVGTLAGRFGPRWFIAVGPLIAAAGYLWMLTVREPVNIWLGVIPGVLLAGTGIAITSTPISSAVLSAINAEQAGIGSAVNNAVARVAGLVAIAIVGSITGARLDLAGFHRVVIVVAIIMIAGAVLSGTLLRNPKPDMTLDPLPVDSNAARRPVANKPEGA
ncbi:MFS transporter [Frondihabitans peucedani]|uniref:MFS transporter n=1 Tax=Frondihabitans peucedani TaxID=598626 RepID=A0ABP8E1H9_9MICO